MVRLTGEVQSCFEISEFVVVFCFPFWASEDDLEFADIGYVLVSGEIAIAGPGDELLENPEVGRLFLGG